MKKICFFWFEVAILLTALVGCQTKGLKPDVVSEGPGSITLCKMREAGPLLAGQVFYIRAEYSFVSRHEEYLIDSSCDKSAIDMVWFDGREKSILDFLSARDSHCRTRGQADFCAIRASLEATVEIVKGRDDQYMMKVLRIHRVDWLPK